MFFRPKFGDNFEFGIKSTGKSHTLFNMKCQMHVHPDLIDLGDTFYSGLCTDVNADVSQNYNTIKTHNITLYKKWL